MNSVVVLIIGLGVAFLGYRVYAKYIDAEDHPGRPETRPLRPRCTWMGWNSCPPAKTSSSAISSSPSPGPRRSSARSSRFSGDGCPPCSGSWGALFHRLGSGLLQRDDCHAERRRLLRRTEPQADLAPGPRDPPGVHLLLPAAHCRGVRQRRGQHGRRPQRRPRWPGSS